MQSQKFKELENSRDARKITHESLKALVIVNQAPVNQYGNDSFNYVQACLFFIEDIALQVNFMTVELLINEMSI